MSENTIERLSEALGDRYVVEGEIGRGGMAIVYLAEDLKHHRKVAIKVLDPALSAATGTERFLREIDVTAKLQHPHILTLIDSGELEGLFYYVMPFVDGPSLKARLQREGALPTEEAVRIAAEIADALSAAHDRGVVHRDVKPGNVLLSGGHAVVADFGIAAALDDAQVGRLTSTGQSIGSPWYMSPEQASGEREVDGRTDVYALGCVLYEMLTGNPPFGGSVMTLLTRKALGEVESLAEARPDVPAGLVSVVSRAMAPDPDDRFQSAGAMGAALVDALPRAAASPWTRRRAALVVAALVGVALLGAWAVQRTREAGQRAVRAAQQLAEVERLANAGDYRGALALAEQVEEAFPDDTVLARLWPRFSFTTDIRTDPPGARVLVQSVDAPEGEWRELGSSPVHDVRFAGLTIESEGPDNYEPQPQHRVRFELDGYQDREVYLTAIVGVPLFGRPAIDPVELVPDAPELDGMVPLPGFTLDGVEYADFYMDRYEVTNARYKAFVDAGGYANPELWPHPIVLEGRQLTFGEAMSLFEDQTGRQGPSTWRLGTYPEGEGEYPVGGVSWYEAAAYAEWRGGSLPTARHWDQGRLYFRENSYVIYPRSNLGADGPRPVGQGRGMSTLGVYDLAGNVREWTYNEVGSDQRATRGGAWPDAPFHVWWIIPRSPLDRDEANGFRLVRTVDDEARLAVAREPVPPTDVRDYRLETPASDAEFELFRRLYAYDPVPLDAVVERVDTAAFWVRELVSFDLPYGERGGAAVYLPRAGGEVFQPVIYWGGSGLIAMSSVDDEWAGAMEFIVRSGRAVVVPILSGGYGRPDPRPAVAHGTTSPIGRSDNGHRDLSIRWVKDVRATIDYLETRADLEADAVGFYGLSFGSGRAPVVLAVEPRLNAAVLNVGGFSNDYPLPEADPFNFAPRVEAPVLMINGEHDIVFPYETNQKPLFDVLGTDPEHKRHYLSPASHIVPLNEVIRETLDWFDRYLGVPAGG